MKHITNAPKTPNIGCLYALGMSSDAYFTWRKQFIEGPPAKTKVYTSDGLAVMGMIGLYKKED